MTQLDEKLTQIHSESGVGRRPLAGRVGGALLGVLFRLSLRKRRR
jgi:hypothetical protein